MKKHFVKIALLFALAGIAILLVIAATSSPPKKQIGKISFQDTNKKISVSGRVVSVKTYDSDKNNFYVITIEDETGRIDAVLSAKNVQISKEEPVSIEGRITNYKNRLQITADKILKKS